MDDYLSTFMDHSNLRRNIGTYNDKLKVSIANYRR